MAGNSLAEKKKRVGALRVKYDSLYRVYEQLLWEGLVGPRHLVLLNHLYNDSKGLARQYKIASYNKY